MIIGARAQHLPEGLRVLLVEDDEAIAEVIELAGIDLQSLVDRASTLAGARERLKTHHYDAVILDLTLPDSSGLHTLESIVEHVEPLGVPVVVHTSQTSHADSLAAVRLHAADYLVKGEVGPAGLMRAVACAVERRRHQQTRQSYERNLRRLVDASADGIVVLDRDGAVIFRNDTAAQLLPVETAIGAVLHGGLVDGDVVELDRIADRVFELLASLVQWRGDSALMVTIRDITAQRQEEDRLLEVNSLLQQANAQLQVLVHRDPLSGALNRRGMDDVLRALSASRRRDGSWASVILADCDHFKRVNDELGYRVGDFVLKRVAEQMREGLRPSDYLCRAGGDEFLAVLPDTREAEAVMAAERLRTAIRDEGTLFLPDGTPVTASFGVVSFPANVDSVEALLHLAQEALRVSKSAGRNSTHGSSGPKPLPAPADLSAVSQPIVALPGEATVAREYLVRGPRWAPSPSELFRLARQHNGVSEFDLEALRTCAAAAKHHSGRVHLNLLPSTVLDVGPAAIVDALPPVLLSRGVWLELSEQHFIGRPIQMRDQLRALKGAGIRLALDDAGFGRSALEEILLLEPDAIKVDVRHLVAPEGREPESVLARMVELTDALGIALIVKSIESEAARDTTLNAGARLAQGHFWSS